MSAAGATAGARPVARQGALFLGGALALLVLSAAASLVLAAYPPSWLIVVAGSVGLCSLLALAVARYEAAVALGLLLLSVVIVEPAPPDAIFGVVMAVAVVTGRFDIGRAPPSIVAVTAVFILLNLASAAEAVDAGRAAVYMAITLYLAILAVWFSGYLTSVRRARTLVVAYLASALASAVLGSLALFVDFPGSELMTVEGQRAKALFEDPNVYGPFLIPIALILIEEILNPRLLRARTSTKAFMLFVLLVGMLLSYSRGAWVNFAIGIVVMLGVLAIRRGGGRRAAAALAVLAVAGTAGGGVLAVTGSLDFLEERAQLQSYDSSRFAAQRRGVEFGEENLLGIGPGQFELRAPVPSHNLYIRSLAEQGYLGLFVTLAFVLITLVFAARNAVLGRDTYGIGSAALLATWFGIAIESFVIDTLHWRHLWLIAAVIWMGTQQPGADEGLPQLEAEPQRRAATT